MIKEITAIVLEEIGEKITNVENNIDVLLSQRPADLDEFEIYRSPELDEEYKKLQQLQDQCRTVKDGTLEDMGLTLEEAISFLEERGVPIILNEEDKHRLRDLSNKTINSTKDCICVHKTKYAPSGDRILSSKDAGAKGKTFEYTLNGKQYSCEPNIQRDTVHLAINGEVSPVPMGNDWGNMQYAILIPFDDIPRSQIIQAPPMDTYTKGSLNLTKGSWLLCPKGEGEELRKRNPTIHVIEYEGDIVQGYPNVIMNALGYKEESIGDWSWENSKDDKAYRDVIKSIGLTDFAHFGSKEAYLEGTLYRMEKYSHLLDSLKKDNAIKTPDDMKRIAPELEQYDSLWDYMGATESKEFLQMLYSVLEQKGILAMRPEFKDVLNSIAEHYQENDGGISVATLSDILSGIPNEFRSELSELNKYKYDQREVIRKLFNTFSLVEIGTDYQHEQVNQHNQAKQHRQKNPPREDPDI